MPPEVNAGEHPEVPASPVSGEAQTPTAVLAAFVASLAGLPPTKREAAALAPEIVAAAAALPEVCPDIAETRATLKANGVDPRVWAKAVKVRRDEIAAAERRALVDAAEQALREQVQEAAKPKGPRKRLGPVVYLTDGTDPESELAASEHLVIYHAKELRFAGALGWIAWDGKRWARDEARAAERCKHTLRTMFLQSVDDATAAVEEYAAAMAAGDEDAQKRAQGARKRAEARMKAATKAQTAKGIAAVLKLAATDRRVRIEVDALDANPYVLNVQNGTLDLRTGILYEHNPADLITKIGRVAWEPGADESDERWLAFLDAATLHDPEMTAYMRRAAGYCLTGDTSQEVVFLVMGPPGAGKGTFENALAACLGDYATTTSFDTWTHKANGQNQRPDLAALVGARFVSCSEASAERRLDEGVISNATGGDKIAACHKYKDPFDYLPRFKLALLVNKPPRINHVAEETGIWRRLKRLPFEHKVMKGEKDVDLKPFFRDPLRGAKAALRWAVAGAVEYLADRKLVEPVRVVEATEALRQENDPLRDFIAATCVVVPGNKDIWIPSARLRALYETWAKEDGVKFLLDAKAMGKTLREAPYGCEPGKTKNTRVWFGLRERQDSDDVTDEAKRAPMTEEEQQRAAWQASVDEQARNG